MLIDGCGGFSCESMLEYRASRPKKGRALKPDQELESYPVNGVLRQCWFRNNMKAFTHHYREQYLKRRNSKPSVIQNSVKEVLINKFQLTVSFLCCFSLSEL